MKKVIYLILLSIIVVVSLFLTKKEDEKQIHTYYMVSFGGEELGMIESDDELLSYIEDKQSEIKKIYSVDNVNVPNELQIQKVMTYDKKIEKVESIYDEITKKSAFTIEGYKVTISGESGEKQVYITNYDILEKAIKNVVEIFVGKESYEKYLNGTQRQIENLGTYIEEIYVENAISTKKENISVSEKIYTTADDLTRYLLYGIDGYSKKYVASIGDTVSDIAFKNKISIKEFMMANPEISHENSLLYPGQEVTISVTDPQIQVTVEQRVAAETVLNYKTIETVDENRLIGDNEVVRQGEDGVLKVISNEKVTNGISVYVEPISTEVLKPAIDKIVIKGGKKVSGVGSLTDWAWPVDNVIITDVFGWRINPISYKRELHAAIDFGAAYGTPIYAANNGIVIVRWNTGSCGNTVEINHNNGYYTEYCHMSKFANITVGQAVEKGQLIGYVGMTGDTTGPHLHFGVWKGNRAWVGTPINPLNLYK